MILFSVWHCLYWIGPIPCAKGQGGANPDNTRRGDFAAIACRQNKRSKQMVRLLSGTGSRRDG